jgi:hypothetical protein
VATNPCFAFQWNYGGRQRFITVDAKDALERAGQVERSRVAIACTLGSTAVWNSLPSTRATPIIGGHRMIPSRARIIGLPQDRRWNWDRSSARVVRADRRRRAERSRRLPLA